MYSYSISIPYNSIGNIIYSGETYSRYINSLIEKLNKESTKYNSLDTSDTYGRLVDQEKYSDRCYNSIDSKIKKVIFNDPATIIIWNDGTKTTVKCQDGDSFSKEHGFATAIIKKLCGNKGNYNELFKKWCS